MIRLLLLGTLALLLTGSPNTADAREPVSTRAYAPENVGQLSISDQIRVIENEYAEQSRGRQIPDDQLDFYLDQIRYSRWTFSRIQADISTSLRGNTGWNTPPNGSWNPQNIICSSTDQRYRECRTPFRGRARLVENISNTRCIEGQNWGARQNMVWVNNGCRGRFADSGNNWGSNQTLRCESSGGRYQECRKPYSSPAYLLRQISSQSCIEGWTWGQSNKSVWVNNGCRAEFGFRGGNGNWNGSGYSVTCSSFNGQYRACAWDRHQGAPRLIERLSGRCTERYDWGYDSNRGLWVANGCSARFGIR